LFQNMLKISIIYDFSLDM